MPRCGGSYISEEQYYDEIVASLRQNLLVYPYHFSEYLMTRERAQLSPFDYYLEMIAEARRRRLQRRRIHPALARESIGGRCSRAGERTTASPTSRLQTSCGCSASAGTSTSKSSTASGARARAHTGARSLARSPPTRAAAPAGRRGGSRSCAVGRYSTSCRRTPSKGTSSTGGGCSLRTCRPRNSRSAPDWVT